MAKPENLRIVADTYEQKCGIPALLRSIGLGVEIKALEAGDYIVAPETAVERKTIRDLLSSVFDGRLFDQCSRLEKNFRHPLLIVEGNIDEVEEVVENPMIFYGALSAVAIDFGIPVIPTPSALHTAKLLFAMCRRDSAKGGPYLKKIKKSSDLQAQQLSVLCSLPGVGEKFAARMLERFGTPLNALSATAAELAKVEGMGGARAKKIRRALDSRNKAFKASDQKTLS